MDQTLHEAFLLKYTKTLFPTEHKKNFIPLKNQSQIPLIIDTLSRKNIHHLILRATDSDIYNLAYLENLAQHLNEEYLPKALRDSTFIFLDLKALSLAQIDSTELKIELTSFFHELTQNNKRIILAINQLQPFFNEETHLNYIMGSLIKSFLSNDAWRIIAVIDAQHDMASQSYLQRYFSEIKLNEPSNSDVTAILKSFRDDLEEFHHVLVPDEIFPYAITIANQYLSGSEPCLEKALKLLDSAASRASAMERTDQTGSSKPILTNGLLAKVISSWTQIPLSHLQHNKFKSKDFISNIQKTIFGQDAAVNLIGLALQYARIKLHNKSGPLCSFLFAGPANVGKTETAFAIAEQLFGHKGTLLQINLEKYKKPSTLSELKVIQQTEEHHHTTLLSAIQKSPYAVVLFENIDQSSATIIDLLQDIFMYGYALDEHGKKYDFSHAIIIITTHLGADRIIDLAHPEPAQEETQVLDLMQLVLNEQKHEPTHQHQHLSPQELCEEMMPTLEEFFSQKLLRHMNIVPFSLLDYSSLEKLVRLKLNNFANILDKNFGLELSYAPEVIRFLVQETLWRGSSTRPIDKILEQHLYSAVAHELVAHGEEINRPKRLLLQLNDAGQLLRCEFVSPGDATLYKM
ncbi:MAG: AAA family ATPase [Gammaproteobacteria bacterium]|nr:AAA family ATPase [Gammaproteobacteria bacterium]